MEKIIITFNKNEFSIFIYLPRMASTETRRRKIADLSNKMRQCPQPTSRPPDNYIMVTTVDGLMAQFDGRQYGNLTDDERDQLATILLRSTRSLNALNLLAEFFNTTFKDSKKVTLPKDVEFAKTIAGGLTFDNETAFAELILKCDYDIVMHVINAYINRSDMHFNIVLNMCRSNYVMLSNLFVAVVRKLRPGICAIKAFYNEDSVECQNAMMLSLVNTILRFTTVDTFDVISALIKLEFIVVGSHDVVLINNTPLDEAFLNGDVKFSINLVEFGILDIAKQLILDARRKMLSQ